MEELKINYFEYKENHRQKTYKSSFAPKANEIFIKISKNDLDKFLATRELRKDKRILLMNDEFSWFKFADVTTTYDNMSMLHFTKTIWPKKENDDGNWVYHSYLLGKKIDYIWYANKK